MKDKTGKLSNEALIGAAVLICLISLVLMILVQIPTPDYLNPFGCLFGIAFIASGVFAFMGLLFRL